MTQWEYLQCRIPGLEKLNRWGRKGWELVAVDPYGVYTLKRSLPKQPTPSTGPH